MITQFHVHTVWIENKKKLAISAPPLYLNIIDVLLHKLVILNEHGQKSLITALSTLLLKDLYIFFHNCTVQCIVHIFMYIVYNTNKYQVGIYQLFNLYQSLGIHTILPLDPSVTEVFGCWLGLPYLSQWCHRPPRRGPCQTWGKPPFPQALSTPVF